MNHTSACLTPAWAKMTACACEYSQSLHFPSQRWPSTTGKDQKPNPEPRPGGSSELPEQRRCAKHVPPSSSVTGDGRRLHNMSVCNARATGRTSLQPRHQGWQLMRCTKKQIQAKPFYSLKMPFLRFQIKETFPGRASRVPNPGRWFPFPVGQWLEQVHVMGESPPRGAGGDVEPHLLSSSTDSLTTSGCDLVE